MKQKLLVSGCAVMSKYFLEMTVGGPCKHLGGWFGLLRHCQEQ